MEPDHSEFVAGLKAPFLSAPALSEGSCSLRSTPSEEAGTDAAKVVDDRNQFKGYIDHPLALTVAGCGSFSVTVSIVFSAVIGMGLGVVEELN